MVVRGGREGGREDDNPLLTSVRCLLSGGGGFSQLNVGQAEIDCEVSNSWVGRQARERR